MKIGAKNFVLLSSVALGLLSASAAFGQQSSVRTTDITVLMPNQLDWIETPKSVPQGATMAVLEGSIRQPGQYTMRFRLPPNYRINPHFSLTTEHITVISGSLNIATGDRSDDSRGQRVPEGGYVIIPAKLPHSIWTDEETIIQLHGLGPWDVHYLKPGSERQ